VIVLGHEVAREKLGLHYREVAVSRLDKANNYFSIYLFLPAAVGPGVYSASNRMSNRSRKIMFLGSKTWPVSKAESLTAIFEPNV
jgi:hypothetical protein